MDQFQILTVKEIQGLLRIGRDKAYRLMKSSDFPSVKIGRTYFITAENFEIWLKKVAS